VAVLRARNAETAREKAWTSKVHPAFESGQRLPCPHEHGVTCARVSARDVETIVHPIDEKDVRMAFFTKERARPFGQADSGVTRTIARPAIGLRLDDTGDPWFVSKTFANDVAPDESAGHDKRVAAKKGPWQRCERRSRRANHRNVRSHGVT
jgi:hypothetical protein